ncbi:hypothetical protein Bbelb_401560 [Branchiostoma belcheri]|nr:hypothetical protein Bbelb_401560 [Branchiostoma belcheri]
MGYPCHTARSRHSPSGTGPARTREAEEIFLKLNDWRVMEDCHPRQRDPGYRRAENGRRLTASSNRGKIPSTLSSVTSDCDLSPFSVYLSNQIPSDLVCRTGRARAAVARGSVIPPDNAVIRFFRANVTPSRVKDGGVCLFHFDLTVRSWRERATRERNGRKKNYELYPGP